MLAALQQNCQHDTLPWGLEQITFARSQDSSVPDSHRVNRAASSMEVLSPWTYHATCITGACRDKHSSLSDPQCSCPTRLGYVCHAHVI